MSFGFTETNVEKAALAWLGELGYGIEAGPEGRPETIALEAPPNHFLFHLDRTAYVEALNVARSVEASDSSEGGEATA